MATAMAMPAENKHLFIKVLLNLNLDGAEKRLGLVS
jgi:hypothetical protein